MFATVARRHSTGTSLPTEGEQADRALAALVSSLPGFIAYVVIEVQEGGLAWISIFEDETSMEEANRRVTAWRGTPPTLPGHRPAD